MQKSFLINQLSPTKRFWKFAVQIDADKLSEICRIRGISADFADKWSDSLYSWQGMIYEAAEEFVQDRAGYIELLSFGTPGSIEDSAHLFPSRYPDLSRPGFGLFLIE